MHQSKSFKQIPQKWDVPQILKWPKDSNLLKHQIWKLEIIYSKHQSWLQRYQSKNFKAVQMQWEHQHKALVVKNSSTRSLTKTQLKYKTLLTPVQDHRFNKILQNKVLMFKSLAIFRLILKMQITSSLMIS